MRNSYLKNAGRALFCAALTISTLGAQNTTDFPRVNVTAPEGPQSQLTVGDDGRTHAYTPNSENNTQGGGCDSILTTLAMGNSNGGIMFDVVPVLDLKVTFIDAVLYGSTGWVYIYQRAGSHVTHEASPAGWNLVDSVQMTLTNQDSLYRIPIYVNYEILAGDTAAFYVTGNNNISVDYTNGTAVGMVYAQDPGMKVLEGTGITFPFAGSYTPRQFNGIINYCLSGLEPCLSTASTYAGGNGYDGNMFDITSNNDITINGFSGNINGTGFMKIYYHMGTYVGTEANASAWTFVDSVNVTSAGAGIPTYIPITCNILVPAGSTVAIYITGTQTGADVNYTNGTAVGNVFMTDGVIAIKEGQGQPYGFNVGITPRIWNGTVHYCLGITGIESEAAQQGVSSTLYPNPVTGISTLNIVTPQPLQNAQVVITDVAGRVVETKANVSSNNVEIDGATMNAGIYFYTVYEGGVALTTGKFIVE